MEPHAELRVEIGSSMGSRIRLRHDSSAPGRGTRHDYSHISRFSGAVGAVGGRRAESFDLRKAIHNSEQNIRTQVCFAPCGTSSIFTAHFGGCVVERV